MVKLSTFDWAMAAEGNTTRAMQAEQNATTRNVASMPAGCAGGVAYQVGWDAVGFCAILKVQIKYDNPFLNNVI